MGKINGRDIWRGIMIGILVLVAILAAGSAIGLNSLTLVSPWIPAGICAAVAAASGVTMQRLWRGLTRSGKFAVNYTIHLIFTTIFLLGFFYTVNYTCADFRGEPNTELEIVDKYREKHYRSRRVGKNHYVRGASYWVYIIEVRLPDGDVKKESVTLSHYNRLRAGGWLPVEIRRGGLGAIVMKFNFRKQ